MENKYYTPSIEEFYIGFEYQILDEDENEENLVYQWREVGAEEIWELEDAADILEHKDNIRIKYLDQSDLEELGFKYYTYFRDGGTSVFRTSNKEYELHFYRTNSILDIDPNKIKIIRHHDNPSLKGQIFIGNIKNKSELKKLLKQLNIN